MKGVMRAHTYTAHTYTMYLLWCTICKTVFSKYFGKLSSLFSACSSLATASSYFRFVLPVNWQLQIWNPYKRIRFTYSLDCVKEICTTCKQPICKALIMRSSYKWKCSLYYKDGLLYTLKKQDRSQKKKTLNPLHPNIKMHILLSDVYTFP